MKVYQLMYRDGYYPSSPEGGLRVFASRELARKAFKELDFKAPFSGKPYVLAEEETDHCDFFIQELEVVE